MQYVSVEHSKRTAYPEKAYSASVLNTFNTWRFKREQPSDKDLLAKFVSQAIAEEAPIPFILYWGKGLRHEAGENERLCLAYLSEMEKRIRRIYSPGAHFTILYTDTHARLNGHDGRMIDRYGESVRSEIPDEAIFSIRRLSNICESAGITEEDVKAAPYVDKHDMTTKLLHCAQKWYRGAGCAEEGASRYFELNMVERLAVQKVFPKSIFVTFNGSELKDIFPTELPIFYMYSIKKGTSVKPWFMDEDTGKPRVSPDLQQGNAAGF